MEIPGGSVVSAQGPLIGAGLALFRGTRENEGALAGLTSNTGP